MSGNAALQSIAQALRESPADYDALLESIGDAEVVMIGEASHGTHEFYQERAKITRRLIEEKGFTAVAVEADWPDAYRVNCYVRGASRDAEANAALSGFDRFPNWMWLNTDVLEFVNWLRAHNDALAPGAAKTGFYGLDLYSLYGSMEAVLRYLGKVDPEAAARARCRYGCFEHFGEDTQAYGYAASFGLSKSCEDGAVNQLIELQRRAAEYSRRDGEAAENEFFYAEQNARLVKNAEEYYRTMFHGRVSSWNLRDRHMAETLDALVAHLDRQGGGRGGATKCVVWAHNSHLGDARATEMGEGDEWNVGQLVREKYGADAVLVGFSTYGGTVTAATDWGKTPQRKRVRPALSGSYEALFHEAGVPRFLLALRSETARGKANRVAADLRAPRLERAIGVIYRPDTERISHYFQARLSDQFDAVLHFDQTCAVEPLERTASWDSAEAPETFPSGV
jgi:erythromycin esterase-like protein